MLASGPATVQCGNDCKIQTSIFLKRVWLELDLWYLGYEENLNGLSDIHVHVYTSNCSTIGMD